HPPHAVVANDELVAAGCRHGHELRAVGAVAEGGRARVTGARAPRHRAQVGPRIGVRDLLALRALAAKGPRTLKGAEQAALAPIGELQRPASAVGLARRARGTVCHCVAIAVTVAI